ncbi:ORF6N domain-containing protein [Pedobacter steynii]|uniref:ORF6N domain-containing protein n=1 Tax=Pedobacter steynii TaxID=430522 RepID=A0A1G9J2P9_9SPHI|nr:ORF6N domain-containing protein [Pedobacter steynii]NQX38120.1 ORF6N domain-containing protein [Pedobacter steynii]SDL31605.1 ORF6N domain-containing protein [Pedobacter steynii]
MSQLKNVIIPEELIVSKIYLIRGQKVMIDRDLSEMYGVETRVLNQAIKRNAKRFPPDFMFQLTVQELSDWKSQNVISNKEKMGLRKLPKVFTEQGVAMLSSVLNSETAIAVNIRIIRTFTRIRQMLTDHTDLRLEVEQIKKKLDHQDKNMEAVFQYLDELLVRKEAPEPDRKSIGYQFGSGKS